MTTTFLDNEATKADYLSHSKRSLNTHQPSTGPPFSASPPIGWFCLKRQLLLWCVQFLRQIYLSGLYVVSDDKTLKK